MGTFEKLMAMAHEELNYNQKLYRLSKNREYNQEPFHKEGLGDGCRASAKGIVNLS